MAKSKKGKKLAMQGIFNFDEMTVLEQTKEEELIYDLAKYLNEFDGEEIKINVTTDEEIEPVN